MIKQQKLKRILLSTLISSIMIGCGGGGNSTEGTSTQALQAQNISQNDTLASEKLTADKEGKITTIKADGRVQGITASKDALFLAEGADGVEIIKIGYSDTISTELLSKIKDINAKQVSLSDNEKILYVEDEAGYIQIINISDLTHPKREGQTTKQKIDNAAISDNGTYKYIPRGKNGLEVVNISNPTALIESTFNKSNAYDVVLADDDTKALIATGPVGINLLDITNPKQVNNLANYRIRGSSVMGLSLNADKDILFVATGNKGVMVFNMEIMLNKLGY